jgi:hypothetical protein
MGEENSFPHLSSFESINPIFVGIRGVSLSLQKPTEAGEIQKKMGVAIIMERSIFYVL